MNTYEAPLLARKVRLALLIIFIAFVAYKGVWWLVAVGVLLLRKETVVRNADGLTANTKTNQSDATDKPDR